ncbi:MAG: ABC transporter permease [Thermaerobacter sp.]|nr:ABC transporter permease [Thermaerobacter sp.]
MARYVARRVGEAVFTLFVVSVAAFVLLKLMPFNLAAIMAGPRASPGTVAQIAQGMGLDQPLPIQFLLWLHQLASGGAALAWQYAPPSLELLFLGSALAAFCAFWIAYVQAKRPRTLFDRAASLITFILFTLPSFWVGFVLIFVFGLQLLWLPAVGPNLDPSSQGFSNWIVEMILPVVTLAITTIATWTTYFRGAIDEALRSDYIRTARAKGLPEDRVIVVHVLRNALLPAITIAGLSLPSLFNNVIVIEWIFAMQGLGSALVYALVAFNYGVAVDLVLVIGAVTICGSLVADLLYAVADPRIKFV